MPQQIPVTTPVQMVNGVTERVYLITPVSLVSKDVRPVLAQHQPCVPAVWQLDIISILTSAHRAITLSKGVLVLASMKLWLVTQDGT